ncbi:MAG: cytochrome C [Colwellia sp.]|nr:cytochrome C [Colwellia sp.]
MKNPTSLCARVKQALLCILLVTCSTFAIGNDIDKPVIHPAIPILDESGKHVLDSGAAYSAKMTCGTAGCHDYDKITHAYHFEMGRDEAGDKFGEQRALDLLTSPGYFGGYACMGGNNPEWLAKKDNKDEASFADKGTAGLIQRCDGCHQGGGWMEKDRHGNRLDEVDPTTVTALDGDYFNRGTDANNMPTSSDVVSQWDWKKSGVVEADCMMCHTDFTALQAHEGSPEDSDALRQFRTMRGKKLIDSGHFRYAGTAMLENLNLNNTDDESKHQTLVNFAKAGKESRGSYDFDLIMENDKPKLEWNAEAFDENGKASIPMLKFPNNDNCMMCHRTSNSRRGFYGFGDKATAEIDPEDGTIVEDYQDDVHKGKTWTEENGETRAIETCNSCHARNYFDPKYANVDLDANHDILKGNSDMDVRNDLDYNPNAKTCTYCHDTSPNKAIPSGHDSMLSAHQELWKANGDMAGYPQNTLTRVTQTHLDVITCQSCHITDKKSRGRDMQISYRYRQEEDDSLKIIPYNPRMRSYWKDKNTGQMLNKTQRNSVFETKEVAGETIGLIVDPISGDELAQVSTRFSHGSLRFGDPDSVEGYKALKQAYDNVLIKAGATNVDTALVWTESNEYIMSHNTRPAVASVQCGDCHSKKQDGSFSSLVSPTGIFGEGNSRKVTTLPDRSLVDDGIVILDLDYMKVNDDGTVTQNTSDVLYSTKVDPFMTVLRASSAKIAEGALTKVNKVTAIAQLKVSEQTTEMLTSHFNTVELFQLTQKQGHKDLRAINLLVNGNATQFADYRVEVHITEHASSAASKAGLGELKSPLYQITARDKQRRPVGGFQDAVLVKMPYQGEQTELDKVTVLHSAYGKTWSELSGDQLIAVMPATTDSQGYVVFETQHFSQFVIADKAAEVDPTPTPTPTPDLVEPENDDSGGTWFLLLLLLLPLAVKRQFN